jgi:hypothetical protein
MKNITFLILSLLFMSLACAQGNALKITNVETGKEKIILQTNTFGLKQMQVKNFLAVYK